MVDVSSQEIIYYIDERLEEVNGKFQNIYPQPEFDLFLYYYYQGQKVAYFDMRQMIQDLSID